MARPLRKPLSPNPNRVASPTTARPVAEPTLFRTPRISRENISWRVVGSDVKIDINISRDGTMPSVPAQLIVEAAPLGAFVSGYRIAEIPVPALDPGGHRRLEFSVPDNVLPSSNLLAHLLAEMLDGRSTEREIDLLVTAEWAGNLNIWFDVEPENSVELHRALGLKVGAGRRAAVGLYLPAAGDPEYKTEIVYNNGAGWKAEVVHAHERLATLVVQAPGRPGTRAKVALLVTRIADGYVVPVDFSFESVEGLSESLGCIAV